MQTKSLNNPSDLPVESVNLLAKCNKKIFSKLNIDEIYHEILDGSFCILKDTKIGLLFIVDTERQKLKLARNKGIDLQHIRNLTINMNRGIAGKAVQTGRIKIVNDVTKYSDLIPKEYILDNNIHTLVSLPLKIMNNVIAVINLYLARCDHFSPVEETMLNILAENAGIAIRYANLYLNIQHTLEDMDSVVQIAKGITSSLELNRVLENILNASQQITNTNITFLWYKDLITTEWKRIFPHNLPAMDIELPDIEQGEGITGYVLKTAKPYICPDVTNDVHYHLTWEKTKSELTIPLIIDNEVKGILNIESTKLNAFSDRQLRLLNMLAEEAAIALRNAQLYEIAEQKTKQFIILKEINEALSYQKSLNEILKIIARESLNIVGHGKKVGFVMLVDRQKKMLETRAACGELFKPVHNYFHIPLEQRSIVAWVVRNGKPRLAPDVTKDSEYIKITSETRSEICVPLFFRGEVIGVIDIESSELNAFDEKDIELLQTLANNTSIATKIGELCDVRLRQLEALYTTGTNISSSLSLDEVLNIIAKEALKAIGPQYRVLLVGLLNKEKDAFEIKVSSGDDLGYTYIGNKISKDKGISGWVVRNREPYLCSNVKKDSYYLEINPEVKSELCVPIICHDEIIGIINVESLQENDFGQFDIQLLQGLADQAGIAIENARLSEGLAETQFQLNEALEVALIGETLAGLSHDIRTCSSLISGEAQWIEHLDEKNKLTIEEAVEAMKKIETHVERIERLIEDLSKRSQLSPPEFEKVNIADILKESIYIMKNQALRQKVSFDIDYHRPQFLVEIDIRRLKRVFINIITNALDAMHEGGVLKIKFNKTKDNFEIKFIDTGEGISKENLDKVWNNFFTTKTHGSGLGLSTCKRIIEADHNGQIKIESEKNKGTVVAIKLPLKQINKFLN